jgi:hypothetical protein
VGIQSILILYAAISSSCWKASTGAAMGKSHYQSLDTCIQDAISHLPPLFAGRAVEIRRKIQHRSRPLPRKIPVSDSLKMIFFVISIRVYDKKYYG